MPDKARVGHAECEEALGKRRAHAVHEAGHAVVAVLKGQRFVAVDLVREGESWGGLRSPSGRIENPEDLRADLDVRLAGPIASKPTGPTRSLPTRLQVRYERRADIHRAFLTLACAMICLRHL